PAAARRDQPPVPAVQPAGGRRLPGDPARFQRLDPPRAPRRRAPRGARPARPRPPAGGRARPPAQFRAVRQGHGPAPHAAFRRRGRGALRDRARAAVARVLLGGVRRMRYRVWHRTTYTYDEDVSNSYGIAHVVPRGSAVQEVESVDVRIEPEP